ncbi:MAG: type II toxin-antitoxin system RelB/DinJ family antitoxin [Synergistaceae bacterium]|nr:type II toxin-antitoxin system RelB/DinJ family antitoxin [Synergistaceae bacterium]
MAVVTVNLDDNMKTELEDIVSAMGMSMSTFFMIYAVRVLRDRRIPFYIEAPEDPFYSPANIERLKKSIAQLEAGGGTEHELIEAD